MKKLWKVPVTLLLVAAMTMALAYPAFAAKPEQAAVTAEIQPLGVKNICPFCGEEIREYVWYTLYSDNGESGHTCTQLIRGEHCGRTYYEREGTPYEESHSNVSSALAAFSHLTTVSPSEHYVIYEWRCNDCGNVAVGERQSTGCTARHCNW